ncbi:MAG TPA: CpsB/CapC family capsule biosynthesis tyrosine phosphatase [Ktedonobacteraceae bacterium]|nr:CpsB/CapC family capsule biosynthesis tyrosine phosphatase [Ktedonobacteraceae bacterium]
MIDIHLHILPGVDDGPETIEESVALARVLVQEGVHTAVATPHYNDLFQQHSAAEIKERVNELQQTLDRHHIPLCLFSGHEALIKPGLIDDIQAGRLATLNGSRYLLLELWHNDWLPETERVIFELRAFGIIPIIAHPECYRAIQQDSHRLLLLLEQGVLTQLTAGSLLGMLGNTTCKCAETLLKKGYIHCIASDAHGPGRRPPALKQSLEVAAHMLGIVEAQQLSVKRPAYVVKNEEISAVSTREFRQQGGERR